MGLLKQQALHEYEIQQWAGPQYGWEMVDCHEDFLSAKEGLKVYKENQPEYLVRIKRDRVQS